MMSQGIPPTLFMANEMADKSRRLTGTGALGKSIQGAQGTAFAQANNRPDSKKSIKGPTLLGGGAQ